MRLLEQLYRRIAYSFGVALLVTVSFSDHSIPIITWCVSVGVFLLSWRIQKEYNAIITLIDGEQKNFNDPIGWAVGHRPKVYYFIWSAVYTYGTYIVVALPLEWFIAESVSYRMYYIVGITLLFIGARIFDSNLRTHKNV